MADTSTSKKQPDSPVSPVRSHDGVPESPTTAKPLDLDDDDITSPTAARMSTTESTETAGRPAPPPKDEQPPAKPPRPIDPRQQAEQTLREAFPTIDPGVVKAVLRASGGQTEPAFNALLEMTDPDAVQREEPPARPPRPAARQAENTSEMSQLEADELYARQLAEHYNNSSPRTRDAYNSNLQGSRQGRPGQNPDPDDVHWRSFIDGANDFADEVRHSANEIIADDLPEIRDSIKKGFLDTQKTVNSWISNFKKNFEDPGDEDVDYTRQNTRQNAQTQQRRSGEQARRSADYGRYDADPQVIGDDFSKLELKDGDHPPRTSSRPIANPNLFRSDQRASSKGSGRKVSFQEGPPEEIKDMYSASPKPTTTTVQTTGTTGGKSSKWQPLSAVEPSPVGENDPFSLGDSDDEKDAKPITLKDTEADKENAETSESVKDTNSKKATVEDAK